jgi:hypothetical protein
MRKELVYAQLKRKWAKNSRLSRIYRNHYQPHEVAQKTKHFGAWLNLFRKNQILANLLKEKMEIDNLNTMKVTLQHWLERLSHKQKLSNLK